MTARQILTLFLEKSPWGDTSADGRVTLDNRLLFVDGELIAMHMPWSKNTYINSEHPNKRASQTLTKSLKAPLRLTREEMNECLKHIQPSSKPSLTGE